MLLQGFNGHCVYAGYLKYRYGSHLVGITASPALNSETVLGTTVITAESGTNSHLIFCASVFWGVGGVGYACLESRITFPRVAATAGEMQLLSGLAPKPGMSGGILPCALTALFTCCLAVSVMSSEGLAQKTWHSLEKCCSTPKLGHWVKSEQMEKISFSEG